MTTVVRLLLVGLAALLVSLATGCGGGADPAKYVDEMNAQQTVLALRFAKLQSEVAPGSSAAANRQALQRFSTTIHRTIAHLERLDVPDGVGDLQQELITALKRYAAVVDGAERKFASNNPQQIDAAQAQLSDAAGSTAAAVNATIAKINDKLH